MKLDIALLEAAILGLLGYRFFVEIARHLKLLTVCQHLNLWLFKETPRQASQHNNHHVVLPSVLHLSSA